VVSTVWVRWWRKWKANWRVSNVIRFSDFFNTVTIPVCGDDSPQPWECLWNLWSSLPWEGDARWQVLFKFFLLSGCYPPLFLHVSSPHFRVGNNPYALLCEFAGNLSILVLFGCCPHLKILPVLPRFASSCFFLLLSVLIAFLPSHS
jgi:hypothetical protein